MNLSGSALAHRRVLGTDPPGQQRHNPAEKQVGDGDLSPGMYVQSGGREAARKPVFDGIKQGIAADRPAFLAQFLTNFYNVDVLGGSKISDRS